MFTLNYRSIEEPNKGLDVIKKRKNRKLRCNFNHEFCAECNHAWHGNSSCEEDKEIKDFATFSGIIPKKCPNCNVWTEKNKGCNHMTCKICSYNWCWLCLKECKEDHYLQEGPCQGKQFDEGGENLREADLIMARLLLRFRTNPLISFIIFPVIIFLTFNNLINTLLSPDAIRQRRNRLNGNNTNNVDFNQDEGFNNLNFEAESNVNVNNVVIQNQDQNQNQEAFINRQVDLEMNNRNTNIENEAQNEPMNCCEKIFAKILLIFMLTIMTLIFSMIFAVFNIFLLFPVTLLLGRFDNIRYNKCLRFQAVMVYSIFFFLSYPFGTTLSFAYFLLLFVYCLIKTIIL